ncbi:MAG TPA: TonB-dependent receptor, partial [bacterium]
MTVAVGSLLRRAAVRRIWRAVGFLFLVEWPVHGTVQSQKSPIDLTELSLEELMDVRVSLVSRKPEKPSETAAAVYVLTQEDLRRSGVTNIPDALRLVPGIMVGRIDVNKWAISCRGFMDLFSNKLLVQIDGRSVYSPIFSGVFWEAQDLFFPDVDRIEVIRGPGATLWGANAVNGIINIVTKPAQETQGGMMQTGWGTEENLTGGFRFGMKMGKDAWIRFYVKQFDREPSVFTDGNAASDVWRISRGGFRMDWDVRSNQSVTLQGDLYGGYVGQSIQIPDWHIRINDLRVPISGGNVLGRWKRTFSGTSEAVLQLYFDRVVRMDTLLVGGSYNVADADFQHRFSIGGPSFVIWGLGYRFIRDHAGENLLVRATPTSRGYDVASAFVQNEMSFYRDRFRIVFGSKFEHNDFTGFEYQPSFRMLLKPGQDHTLWGAVSRAVRTPSRVESDVDVFGLLMSNPHLPSERLNAYEIGYRYHSSAHFYMDWTAYSNHYNRLRTQEIKVMDYKKSAHIFGFEAAADWTPYDCWRIRGSYTHCRMEKNLDAGSVDIRSKEEESEFPRHQWVLHSTMEIFRKA